MCAASKNCEKFTKTFFDIDKSKKPVTSACYDKQLSIQIYMQPFLHYMSQ